MRKLLLLLSLWGGQLLAEPDLYLRFAVEILNDDENGDKYLLGYMGRAELYLSISSTQSPNQRVIIPLNVGPRSGHKVMAIETPFKFVKGQKETYLIELIDNDKPIYRKAESALGDAFYLLYAGGKLTAILKGKDLPSEGLDKAQRLGEKAEVFIRKSFKVDKDFKSYGHAEFNQPTVPEKAKRDTNKLTIMESKTKARAHLFPYYGEKVSSSKPK